MGQRIRVADPGRWRVLGGSVRGTSHEERDIPCQDACGLLRLDTDEGEVLLLVACDGAGSASHAETGARLAANTLVRAVTSWFAAGERAANLHEEDVREWVQQAIAALEEEATALEVPVRELACTLLLAVVAPESAVFAQLGDGAIVINHREGYSPVFWPQNGEYANTTYFLTEGEARARTRYSLIRGTVDEVSLFTDGLQSLALHYESHSAHAPFFLPLFARLRREPAGVREEMMGALESFLTSEPVNERTDDDKTLLLATRRAPDRRDWDTRPAEASAEVVEGRQDEEAESSEREVEETPGESEEERSSVSLEKRELAEEAESTEEAEPSPEEESPVA